MTAVAIISTLFPHLPEDAMPGFGLALGAGTALLVGLTILGFHPVALVTAAVLVPLLAVLYVIAVDVYEDAPTLVLAMTALWGAASGLVVGALVHRFVPTDPGLAVGAGQALSLHLGSLLARGVALPLIEGGLMIAGPLVLLRHRHFNDVLDGTTFAMVSTVTFVGARVLGDALPLLASGPQPGGATLAWVLRIVTTAVLVPVLSAGLIGGLGGALWLRFRAPVRDRAALGAIGRPLVAAVVAAVGLVVVGLARVLLSQAAAAAVIVAVTIAAVLWLRRVIHLGLVEEAGELAAIGEVTCSNCGRPTPAGRFCTRCGVALRALPKGRGA